MHNSHIIKKPGNKSYYEYSLEKHVLFYENKMYNLKKHKAKRSFKSKKNCIFYEYNS